MSTVSFVLLLVWDVTTYNRFILLYLIKQKEVADQSQKAKKKDEKK